MGASGSTGMTTPVDKQEAYFRARSKGATQAAAARLAGVSPNTAKKLEGIARPDGRAVQRERLQETMGEPLPYEDLCPEAQRAWNDFKYFQERYLGRIAIPWQIEAAERIVAMIESEEEEWAVINCPPGSGKSTTFTHDIPCWLTVRDRAITGLIGTAVQTNGRLYIQNLKETFERTAPVKAHPVKKKQGLEVDATGVLAEDFGRFKPESGIWAADRFVVAQVGGQTSNQKEPTWSCYGRKGGVLGMRYQFVIWDDLVDPDRVDNQLLIDEDQEWYSDIAESRLEPGGTFILQGQRLGPNDLYGYALKMKRYVDEFDIDAEDDDLEGTVPKYTHIKYKAHYEELCEGNHLPSAPAYGEPGGCLLFPRRLSWRRLSPMMIERQSRFQVVYQQEDVDPDEVLVHRNWVSGEGGYVGCWDKGRDHREVPRGVDLGKCVSVVSVDPSPTQYWGITWWLIDPHGPAGPNRYLIDLERRGMGANKFLDFIAADSSFVGLAEEWQIRSYELGIPITHWIVERNGAQQFMLQTDMIQQWQRRHGVRIIPHHTGAYNKNSEDLGVQAIVPGPWERGLIRLPGKNTRAGGNEKGRMLALKLVEEVTSYPNSHTTDCLMADWFMEIHLPELLKFSKRHADSDRAHAPRPSWLTEEMAAQKRVVGIPERPARITAQQRMIELAQQRAAS